ncbi:uncharacterized protein A1O5_03338 [Cladophialophora psammophila CBS 110553]|uniref:Protein disulfide-isomerase n=1 Tax=Cladophialophora psammophila CBS 110553 TaxID=1182543 RepID=W9WZD4_9EURO|nr:uncharacterized protein A1O5_03338 [Cladophialophora psammophila CBS 110553]EXJ73577.1 hypothetical protein A1O5_03338 [Cladophialophora psammophila CBS 110553]
MSWDFEFVWYVPSFLGGVLILLDSSDSLSTQPWYDQCKILSSELELALKALQPWPSAKLLLINCEVESDTCSSYGITSYPTVRLFHGPKQIRYRGKFRASSITTEVLKVILPPVSHSNRQILDTTKSLDIPLLLFTESEDDTSQSSTVITQVAEKLHGKFFVMTTHDLTLAEEEGVKPPFIVVLNSLDEVKPLYQGKIGSEVLHPLHTGSIPLAFILAGTDEERKALAESLKHIALKYRGRVNFVTVDTKSLSFLLEPLGVDPRRLPAFALHRGDNDEVFVYDQNRKVNAKDVEVFVQRTLNWPDKEL